MLELASQKAQEPATSFQLLREVATRLSCQRQALTQFGAFDDIKESEPQQRIITSSSFAKPPTNTKTPHRRMVVPAAHSVRAWNWKTEQNRQERRKRTAETRQKLLANLERLHRDTLSLCTNLLDHQPHVWDRFSKADQHLLRATFEQIRSRHGGTIENLVDLCDTLHDNDRHHHVHRMWLERFLRGRLGVQLLCDHGVALGKKPNGGIALGSDDLLKSVLEDAVTEAQHMCDAHYELAPEVTVDFVNHGKELSLVRPWIHHALVEVLKNGMASTIERHKGKAIEGLPPIEVTTSIQQDNTLSIEVRDRGSGVGSLESAFQFGHSGGDRRRWDRLEEQQSYAAVRSPLSSLGVGLTTSRHMMEYFGGALELRNTKGSEVSALSGCVATLRLALADECLAEQLPN